MLPMSWHQEIFWLNLAFEWVPGARQTPNSKLRQYGQRKITNGWQNMGGNTYQTAAFFILSKMMHVSSTFETLVIIGFDALFLPMTGLWSPLRSTTELYSRMVVTVQSLQVAGQQRLWWNHDFLSRQTGLPWSKSIHFVSCNHHATYKSFKSISFLAGSLICELCRQFFEQGWVTGTGGSICIRFGNRIFMTPSGVPKERIEPEDLFVLDVKGNMLAVPCRKPGSVKPPKLSG